MIVSFGSPETEDLFHARATARVRRFPPEILRAARKRLDLLNLAHRLGDLAILPGNRLEALGGRLDGYHAIRVNSQWRVVFRWTGDGPAEVAVLDYH